MQRNRMQRNRKSAHDFAGTPSGAEPAGNPPMRERATQQAGQSFARDKAAPSGFQRTALSLAIGLYLGWLLFLLLVALDVIR